jgi:tRNA G10  N-methylase Trm11
MKHTYVCILGRQPAIGMAELESRFGSEALQPVQGGIALLESETQPNFDHFGGTLKAAKLLTRLDYTDWHKLSDYLQKNLPQHLEHLPDSKITIGLSVYGLQTNPKQINAAALSLKKIIKKSGRPARVVPNPEAALNTAQVLHNKLTDQAGLELILIKNGNSTLLAQTVWVQDIEAYRRRDQERPMRDARVGMLPPKLAQIIINLAGAEPSSQLLDPFCGTGVLLQEALLMGIDVHGSDIDKRMIEYSEKNLDWLYEQKDAGQGGDRGVMYVLKTEDATTLELESDYIACETYLGRPFSSPPDQETLQKVVHDVNIIHKKFLQNIARQTKPGFRMCIAVPAWHIKGRFKHLPVLDHLKELGYNRMSFVQARTEDLIYHRANQVVGRELIVLTRI